jgi:molybdopterin converting factor small subunit
VALSLTVECCGILEQVCGGARRELGVSDFPVIVEEALAQFAAENPAAAEYLPYVACAVGDAVVQRDYALREGETLVLLPPVSGG